MGRTVLQTVARQGAQLSRHIRVMLLLITGMKHYHCILRFEQRREPAYTVGKCVRNRHKRDWTIKGLITQN